MILDKLEIDRKAYGEYKDKYVGTVRFTGEAGSVSIIMNPEVTESFLALAGELLIAHIEVAGQCLQADIETAVGKALKTNQTAIQIASALRGKQILIEQPATEDE